MKLNDLAAAFAGLTQANRPIRLRLAHETGVSDDVLLVKQVSGVETMCGGIEYRLLCVAAQAGLPIKQFIAAPAELQFVTDAGGLHAVCGIVGAAVEGESDGGLATYQLTLCDAMTLMEKSASSRIFRHKNEVEISQLILADWRRDNPVLARAFDFELRSLRSDYPQREFTMQYNESDSAFLRRLWKRRGLAWFFQAGKAAAGDDTPQHTLVLFDQVESLAPNVAGTVRYHRDDGTEARDSVTAWHAVRTLTPGGVTRQSWDYKEARMMNVKQPGRNDQGALGNGFATSLDDGLIDVPHAGDSRVDYDDLAELRMLRHEYEAKSMRGESGVRDLCVGQWNGVSGHAEIDTHPAKEREFVITELRVEAENNLPKTVNDRAQRLFALNRWCTDDATAERSAGLTQASVERGARYTNQFTCVRRGIAIVPAYDPRIDLPRTGQLNAVVIGPAGEAVYCDDMGRVRVRFPGCRPDERAGSPVQEEGVTQYDSAWVRVATTWAGAQFGAISLPRVGTMVTISFLGGDPDKPQISAAVHGGTTPPPSFSHVSRLPGDRYLSGIVSQEIHGTRLNQLRIDDTPGQISAQLASDHAATQLNLGFLTHPRRDGKATPRGEGFELASSHSGAIRSAKSLLISAWKRLDATGNQLSSEEHLALMQDCLDLFKSLGEYALEHQALALDPVPQAELKDDVAAAAGGSNTDPQGQGGKPTLSVTAPAGIALSTPKTIVSYAGVNVDTVAQQHLQLTSGQRFNVNAGKGISLFSHHDGIRAIAHHGKFVMQSQHDDTEINSAKNIKLTATDGIISLMAKEIGLIAEDGSFIKIGAGITLGTNSEIRNKAAGFPFSGPATMPVELPNFSSGDPDQKFILKYGAHTEGAAIAPNRAFEIDMSDGSTLKGVSDALGKTDILQRDAMHIAKVRIVANKK